MPTKDNFHMGFTEIFHRQSETKLRRVKYIWEYYLPKCIAIKCSTICYSPHLWYLEVWLRLLRLMRGNLGWIVSRGSPWALLSNMTLWNESEGKKIFCGALWLVIEKKERLRHSVLTLLCEGTVISISGWIVSISFWCAKRISLYAS